LSDNVVKICSRQKSNAFPSLNSHPDLILPADLGGQVDVQKVNMSKSANLLCLVILMVLTGTNSCRPQAQEERLRYEPIERENHSEGGRLFEERQPEFFVVVESSDTEAFYDLISAHTRQTLRNLNFDDQFGIVVFQGCQPDFSSPPFGVEVQSLHRRDSSIIIEAHICGHVEDREWYPEVASPYHSIAAWREEDMHGDFEFILKVDGETVVNRIHYLP
jgi:hypothetical protein